jgi:hypothetical protein
MSAIVLSDADALLAGSSATGSDDARPMQRRTLHSASRSWLLPAALGAASSSNVLPDSHEQERADLDPITATRAPAAKSP